MSKRERVPTERRYRGAEERDAATAMRHAISLLNSRNLEFLWRLSAIMSLLEISERDFTTSSLWLFLNNVRVRLFGEVVLRSKASVDKVGRLDPLTLRNVLDDLQNAMSDDNALAEMSAANHTASAPRELDRFMARMASTQIAEQDLMFHLRCGRLVGMFDYLPRDQRSRIPKRDLDTVERILPQISATLGSSIDALVRAVVLIANLYHVKFDRIHSRLIRITPTMTESRIAIGHASDRLLQDLLWAATLEDFVLTPRAISNLTKGLLSVEAIFSALKLLSHTTADLRQLQQSEPEYQLGHPSTSLSPLDRFPIVRLEGGIGETTRFIVPNMRLLLKALPYALDYQLCKELGNDYNQARGALQELYLRCLIAEELPTTHIIPERTYGKEHRAGPDLAVIEGDTGRLVLVESKARRIAAATRHILSRELLHKNLADAFAAIARLPAKLEDLYATLPGFRDVQEILDSTRSEDPVCVAVLSDSVFSMAEQLRHDIAADSSHVLHDFPYPWAIVGLDTFERAVHVAASTGCSLWSVFRKHWDVSGRNLEPPYDYQSAPADAIGGIEFPEEQTFGARFLERAGERWLGQISQSATD